VAVKADYHNVNPAPYDFPWLFYLSSHTSCFSTITSSPRISIAESENMTNSMETDSEDRHRAESPALSDTPVLTTLSRPPSPILRYDAYASPEKFQDSPRPSDRPTTNGTIAQHTIALLGTDGGFGTLDRLPIELGQEIYGLAFGIDL
jgi:hypothetical protein